MKLALVSPGWTRELMIIHLRSAIASYEDRKFVMISISTELPARVLQSDVRLSRSLAKEGRQMRLSISRQSE